MRIFLSTVAMTFAMATALITLPAKADHWHGRGYAVRPFMGFGYAYGYPYYRFGFGYGPFYYPPPYVGFGVTVAPERRPRGRGDKETSTGETRQALKLYVYPSAGQSEKQMADDRYDCHVWAVDQTGYDPTLGAGRKSDADDYARAFTACMEGRNYVVK
jgi:hypothetical protein